MHYEDDFSKLINPPKPEWRPTYWTPMKSERSLGDDFCDFLEEYFTPPRLTGDEWKVLDWQRWLYQHIFELNEDGNLRYREVFLMIPRKESKTTSTAGIATYFGAKGKDGDEIFIAANAKKQADIAFNNILESIKKSPSLKLVLEHKHFKIKNKFKNIFISAISKNADSNWGTGPFLVVADEIMAWDGAGYSAGGRRFYDSLKTGSGDRKEFLFIGITTAGDNLEGLGYELYEKGKKIANGELEDDKFGFFFWGAEDHDDIHDPKTWKKANPMLQAGIKSMEVFESDYRNLKDTNINTFERLYLNKWIKINESETFLLPNYIKKATEKNPTAKIPEGASVCLGFDGSFTNDSTGIVGIDLDTPILELLGSWERPKDASDWFVDFEEVDEKMKEIFETYKVEKLYCDPSYARELIQKWQKRWGRAIVREIPPSPARMIPMSAHFKQALYTGEVFINKDAKRLIQHYQNAYISERGLPRKEHQKSPKKIDYLVCSILAVGAKKEITDLKERMEARANALRRR